MPSGLPLEDVHERRAARPANVVREPDACALHLAPCGLSPQLLDDLHGLRDARRAEAFETGESGHSRASLVDGQ